mgnify:CR=1 FL=1
MFGFIDALFARLDRVSETQSRRMAQTAGRRSFLARAGTLILGGAVLPMLPFEKSFATGTAAGPVAAGDDPATRALWAAHRARMERLLAGMRAAPNLGPEFAAGFDALYPRLAEKHGVSLLPFFLDGVAADTRYLLADGMHPNASGVDVMVDKALPFVERVVVEVKEAS